MNRLYFGDNLDWLQNRDEFPNESVDLVYLDPPFNSNADYNVLFRETSGAVSQAQFHAFTDTWSWADAAETYHDFIDKCPNVAVTTMMEAFHSFLKNSPMMAYLAMMAPRLVELHRVLKETGSLYLHCDPTASAYLRLLLDGIFEAENLRNEIVWRRTTAKALMTRRLPNNHDLLLGYQKGPAATWNVEAVYTPYDAANLDEKTAKKYSGRDADGRRYTLGDLNNPNPDRPNLTYEFLGHTKVWRWTKDRMEAAYKAGLVVQPSPGAVPRLKRYLGHARGRRWANYADQQHLLGSIQPSGQMDGVSFKCAYCLAGSSGLNSASLAKSAALASQFAGHLLDGDGNQSGRSEFADGIIGASPDHNHAIVANALGFTCRPGFARRRRAR